MKQSNFFHSYPLISKSYNLEIITSRRVLSQLDLLIQIYCENTCTLQKTVQLHKVDNYDLFSPNQSHCKFICIVKILKVNGVQHKWLLEFLLFCMDLIIKIYVVSTHNLLDVQVLFCFCFFDNFSPLRLFFYKSKFNIILQLIFNNINTYWLIIYEYWIVKIKCKGH